MLEQEYRNTALDRGANEGCASPRLPLLETARQIGDVLDGVADMLSCALEALEGQKNEGTGVTAVKAADGLRGELGLSMKRAQEIAEKAGTLVASLMG